jgi:hypothetical protein
MAVDADAEFLPPGEVPNNPPDGRPYRPNPSEVPPPPPVVDTYLEAEQVHGEWHVLRVVVTDIGTFTSHQEATDFIARQGDPETEALR